MERPHQAENHAMFEAPQPPEPDHIAEGLAQLEASGLTPEQAYSIGSATMYMDERCKGTIAEAFARHPVVRQGISAAVEIARGNNTDVEVAALASIGFFLKRDPETNQPVREDLSQRLKKNRPAAGY
jgi:hypothetical protein